jgi:hypothetical protein
MMLNQASGKYNITWLPINAINTDAMISLGQSHFIFALLKKLNINQVLYIPDKIVCHRKTL